jgi:hypothetical protein
MGQVPWSTCHPSCMIRLAKLLARQTFSEHAAALHSGQGSTRAMLGTRRSQGCLRTPANLFGEGVSLLHCYQIQRRALVRRLSSRSQ